MRREMPLDGEWLLAPDPQNGGESEGWSRGPVRGALAARVPGIIQEMYPGYHGVAWYWRELIAPAPTEPGSRFLLRFEAVDYLARVWLNGVYLGEHEGGETPFELEATEAIQPGCRNLLAVRVLNPTNERIDGYLLGETPHRNKSVPPVVGGGYNYGGIVEGVRLIEVPPVRLVDLFVWGCAHSGIVRVQASVRNASSERVGVRLWCGMTAAHSDAVLSDGESAAEVAPGETTLELEFVASHYRLWELDDPALYRVTARLMTATGTEDRLSARFGFRDFRVVNGFFRLNDRRLFLKSTHTGNHVPYGQVVPPPGAPGLLRQDLLYSKSCGYNMIRFISGIAHPWQLDLCDEIGLMVYEESMAAWCLQDSPEMGKRFNDAVREMVRRDRNHPSVTIWGMLNETPHGPVFCQAVESLETIRELDDTRLVLLGSGRWDNQFRIGSVSSPGSREWERVWGAEAAEYEKPLEWSGMGYVVGAGDAHLYPSVPHRPETRRLIRNLGAEGQPVFLSEYGVGSLMNVIAEARGYEQRRLQPETDDLQLLRSMAERFQQDWERFGMDGVYPFPEDLLRESARLHCRQRRNGFDLIRSNPQIAGFNLTGMLDHGMTGEGAWTFWREWKPGIADTLRDGWAPLRWCLFVTPLHAYAGDSVHLEAVLANEEVLQPGDYPARLRIAGPAGTVWDQEVTARIPSAPEGGDPPFAAPVFSGTVRLDGPAGEYVLAADLQEGGAAAGSRLTFFVSDRQALPRAECEAVLWGIEPDVEVWLAGHGLQRLTSDRKDAPPLILVGNPPEDEGGEVEWEELWGWVEGGSTAVFLSPAAFRRGDDPGGRLPGAIQGHFIEFNDWLYHKECVANRHPVFEGLPGPGILDWGYYGPVISPTLFEPERLPDEVIAAAFALGYPCPGGYASGIMIGAYRLGEGRVLINTLRVVDTVGRHPAADRILLNMIRWGLLVLRP